MFSFNLFGTTKIDRSAPVVLKQLRDVSTYTAATGEFESTVDIESDSSWLPSFIDGERAIFVGVGTVDAQVDFSQLSKDAIVVGENGAVTVTLPQPTLGKAHVDPSRSHVANRDRGLVNRIAGMFKDNPTSEQELYVTAQHRIAKANGATVDVDVADARDRVASAEMPVVGALRVALEQHIGSDQLQLHRCRLEQRPPREPEHDALGRDHRLVARPRHVADRHPIGLHADYPSEVYIEVAIDLHGPLEPCADVTGERSAHQVPRKEQDQQHECRHDAR